MLVFMSFLLLPGALVDIAQAAPAPTLPFRHNQAPHFHHQAHRRQFQLLPSLHQILHPVPVRHQRHHQPHFPSKIPTRLNKFEHFKANQGFNTSKKHQQIRRREGTEIFEGRKPDIIHYIESPQLGSKVSYSGLIDERTPKTSIVKESTFNVPNVIVGYIGN